MKFAIKLLLIAGALTSFNLVAEDTGENKVKPITGGGEELTQEEVDKKIGRYGEVDEIPDDFQFNPAEEKLWLSNHLVNINEPLSLYYEFNKSGSYEEGFTDSVYLKILEINEDGTKNAALDFFTGERKQIVTEDNVTNIIGNPVLGIFMQGDVYEMGRLTEGHWRYFHKRIKVALREVAKVEQTSFVFNEKEYSGEKVFFSPYIEDPHRRDFEQFAEKYYEVILSDEIPGSIYQIKTVIPARGDESAEPLILETLTLMDVK